MRNSAVLAAVVLGLGAIALVALSLAGGDAEGHGGHPQKKLFDDRWHYAPQGGINLTTSDFWYQCGSSEGDCQSRWGAAAQDAVNDWNAQQMAIDFNQVPGQSLDNDMNIFIQDAVLGDPTLLGYATWYDQSGTECFFTCTYYFAEVYVSDAAHSDEYATYEERRGTTAHEVGHTLSLRHESTDAGENQLFDCGMDDTGPIPYSIMAYDCIDPVEIGGLGLYEVEPWDVCGVNHAYHDPAIGYAGCGDVGPTQTPGPTPTQGPTPGPGQEFWVDTDCGGAFNIGDAINVARRQVNLPVSQQPGCPTLGLSVMVNGTQRIWGDTDCGGAFNIGDAINVARKQVNLAVNSQPGCPTLGSIVNIGEGGSPTQTPGPTPGGSNDCDNLSPPVPIPDGDFDGVDLTVEFFDDFYIDYLALCVNIVHPWIGDLYITLTHEDTFNSVAVVEYVGDPPGFCEGGGDFFVYLTDDALTSLEEGCDNLVGEFYPHNPLSDFYGELIAGTWTINVADDFEPDAGMLLGAFLEWEGVSARTGERVRGTIALQP